jgi:hypothetical protein
MGVNEREFKERATGGNTVEGRDILQSCARFSRSRAGTIGLGKSAEYQK